MSHAKSKVPCPLPDCWQDEERCAALLAPFRMRSVNMEHYDAKMKFWQDLIAQYCEHKGAATFTRREIQMQYARGERLPACLEAVIADLLQTKKIRLRTEYEYDPVNSWTGWAINSLVKKPLSWGLGRIKSGVGLTDESTQSGIVQYVQLDIMQKFCKRLQAKVLQSQQGQLLHYDALRALCDAVALDLTPDALHLCLHTLHCQLKIGLEYKQADGERHIHLVKIPVLGETNVLISETDRAVHNLEMTQSNLLQQLEALEVDIKSNESKARAYLKENKRQLAKTYLRKKHLLEKNHEKRSVALHNIEMLLSSVGEAQTNGDILDAYKIGSKALQHALDASGLKYDNVDEIIAEVRDTMDTHKELQDAIGNVSVAENLSMYDNDELERELQNIMTDDANAGNSTPKRPSNVNNNDSSPKDVAKTTGGATAGPAIQPKITVANATLADVLTQAASNNNNKTQTHTSVTTVTESDLLAMLEQLEVEEGSVKSNTSSANVM